MVSFIYDIEFSTAKPVRVSSGIFESLSQPGSAFQGIGDSHYGVESKPVLKCAIKIILLLNADN